MSNSESFSNHNQLTNENKWTHTRHRIKMGDINEETERKERTIKAEMNGGRWSVTQALSSTVMHQGGLVSSQELVNYAGGMSGPANLSTQEPWPCWSHHWPVVPLHFDSSTTFPFTCFWSFFIASKRSKSRRETITGWNVLRFQRRSARQNCRTFRPDGIYNHFLLILSNRLHGEDAFHCNRSLKCALEPLTTKLTMWWSRVNNLSAFTGLRLFRLLRLSVNSRNETKALRERSN